MTTPVYTSPFTGTVVTPTDVSYSSLSFGVNTPLFWPSIVNQGVGQNPATRIIDCVATTTGLAIALPEADQGTLGADILFRNKGSNSFVVTDYLGGNSVTIAAGISEYFYLTDNTTSAGVWGSVTFGAGTSSANAAALAGAGLTTINGQLATTQNIVDISTAPTLTDISRAATYNWGSGVGNIPLPNTSSLSRGWFIAFRNNGTGALSFTPVAPQLINGTTSITTNPGDSGFIFYDANTTPGSFITVGWAAPSNVVFTAATYDVDSIVGNTLNLSSNAPIIQTYVAQSGTRTQTLEVTLPAITQLYVLLNSTNQTGYNITFQNQGSSQSPLVLSSGNTYTLLSDGEFLYILNSSSSSVFKAVNGNASGPSYSFLNDTHTGMYLDGTSILGLSANSTEIVKIDNTNTSAPLVTVNARIAASSISGGTF
jgi:hypothetical protein